MSKSKELKEFLETYPDLGSKILGMSGIFYSDIYGRSKSHKSLVTPARERENTLQILKYSNIPDIIKELVMNGQIKKLDMILKHSNYKKEYIIKAAVIANENCQYKVLHHLLSIMKVHLTKKDYTQYLHVFLTLSIKKKQFECVKVLTSIREVPEYDIDRIMITLVFLAKTIKTDYDKDKYDKDDIDMLLLLSANFSNAISKNLTNKYVEASAFQIFEFLQPLTHLYKIDKIFRLYMDILNS